MTQAEIQNWVPGDLVSNAQFHMKSFKTEDLSVKSKYQLLTSMITPRPIAFISTQSEDGRDNLSPFSFFNGTGTNPLSVMVSLVPKRDGDLKDTLKNIFATKEFVINGVNEDLLAPMHHSSAGYDFDEDEFEKVGLKKADSLSVKPKRVVGSPWQMECKLYNSMTVGDGSIGSGTIVVGEVLQIHLAQELCKDDLLDFKLTKPVARIGGSEYALAGETLEMPAAQKN